MSDTMPPPDKVGAGRAWRCDLGAFARNFGFSREDDATLVSWIIEAPWAHPIWHSYWFCLVHLRPMADNRETKTYLPGATHELWLYALDPKTPRAPQLNAARPAFLTPGNFAAQIIEPSDEAAISRIEGAVDLILNGELNPDTDALRQWVALFGDAMIKRGWR